MIIFVMGPLMLFIVSPFTRTLQTAQLIFENKLPFQINAAVREQLVNSCDVGSPPHKLTKNFLILALIIWMNVGGMTEKKITEGLQLSLKRF